MANVKPAGASKYGESGAGEDDDYDPHLYRTVEKPTNNAETLIHMLKGCMGTGILAMPEAFKNSGLANGSVSTVFITIVCTYCLHILVTAQYVLCKRLKIPFLTFPESMKKALETGPQCLRKFANMSPYIVDFFMVIYQVGICCVYVVFVAANVKAVADEYTPSNMAIELYILMCFIPFMLILSIRNLKLLAPFSTVANVFTLGCFGIVLYYVFRDLPISEFGDRPHFGTFYTYPLYFGTTLFSVEAIGVVIALENNMKTPKSFGAVIDIAAVIIVIFYVGLGFLGYWRYGEDIEPSITLNLPQADILSKVTRILYSLAILVTYGLQGYVPVKIMWDTYILKHLEGSNHLLAWEYLLRVVTVLITFVFAVTIPLLALFISLVGAFCLSALGLVFPAIIDMCVRYPDHLGPLKYIVIKDVLLIFFGLVGLLSGSYSCISEIVSELSSRNTK